MKIVNSMLVLASLGMLFVILGCYSLSHISDVNAQQPGNWSQIIEQNFPEKVNPAASPAAVFPVKVNYESPTIVLLGGDLIFGNAFNTDLWAAMNLLKSQYGFKIQQVMTSGVGSVGNATTVYILMTK